jgi:hypothetical protein
MAAPILSYRPEIKIEIAGVDVTKHLGDVGSCTIRKNLYQPAGEFQLIFPDMPVSGGRRESLYGVVNPLDRIVISMRRWREPEPTIGPWITALTGFVRSVGRDEQVGPDGRPRRQVVIAGQDTGAAFLMEQVSAFITYQNNNIDAPRPGKLNWLMEYGLQGQAQPVQDFIWDVATKTTQSIMDAVGFQYQQMFSVKKGTVLPYSAFSQEGTICEMLYRYADGPWNELFVRENRRPNMIDPELVFRPTPWVDYNGNPLPDADMSSVTIWEINKKELLALRAHRDDSELVNHVWIHTPVSVSGANTQFFSRLKGLVNAETRGKYGDRIQQEATRLFPYAQPTSSINLPMAAQRAVDDDAESWAEERRDWMVLAQNRIHDFERGSITMKGYPMMRVGDYFRLHRGDIVWQGYIVNIVNDFQPFRQYLTTMDYIRGNQIKVRRAIQNPWDVERKTGD